jgi:hypothetical protein
MRVWVLTETSMKMRVFLDTESYGLIEVAKYQNFQAQFIFLIMGSLRVSETSVYFYETTHRTILLFTRFSLYVLPHSLWEFI